MSESALRALHRHGQSPWLDFIQRRLVRSGELARLIEDEGVRGMTSNPAIFEQAIAHSTDYDEEIQALARAGRGVGEIYETLALADVREAADVFRPLYEESRGEDGFVSLEVSPHLAHETEATVREAQRLWALLDRPNVMIKVPATPAGLPAIRKLLAEGLNVNVTLLFGLGPYRAVTEAHLAGLEDAAANGRRIERIASVASFFLSRIDSAVDAELERIARDGGPRARRAASLRGEIAIASARRAYAIFEEVRGSERFRSLARRGARSQRLLWASTSTKNPEYSDVKYVEPLVGPHTVSTMPRSTLEAYRDHGHPAPRLREGREEAARVLDHLAEAGIDLDEITERLLGEGVTRFVEPFDALHAALERKCRAAPAAAAPSPPSPPASGSRPVPSVDPEHFDAVLFDLDGVLTDTARLHAACWKRVFDDLLDRLAKEQAEPLHSFDVETDYRRYVDGKDRLDGVRDFLASRGIELPEGSAESSAQEDSVHGVGRRKDALFERALGDEGVEVYEGSLRWLQRLRASGLRTAVVSASHHCTEVLRAVGIAELFDARVDGEVADRLALAGKPEPDTYLEAARQLRVDPPRAVVVEDALAGVRAGRAGGFGLVVGVARRGSEEDLASAGADVVVRDLGEMLP